MVGLGLLVVHVWQPSTLDDRFDFPADRYFAAHRTLDGKTTTHIFVSMSETLTVIVVGVAVGLALLALFRRWREPVFLAAALVGETAIFTATTLVVDRRRPPVAHLDASPPTSSFPSGHTAAAICLYGGIAQICSARVRSAAVRTLVWVLAIALPVLVAYGRVYRGMHYPTDVLGGAILGVLWLSWVHRVLPLDAARRRRRAAPG